jgi:hypothetical protein
MAGLEDLVERAARRVSGVSVLMFIAGRYAAD